MAPPSEEKSTNPFYEKLGSGDQEIEYFNAHSNNMQGTCERQHVFGHQYVSGDSINLMIYKESGDYRVDIFQGTIFTLKIVQCLRNLLVLLDSKGTCIALLENVTPYDRWDVSAIKESIASSEKIFSASRNDTVIHVSIEDKNSPFDHVDFQIKWLDKTCTVYEGDSSAVIAKMRAEDSEDKFWVEIYPNVNYAFVVMLFVIADAMKYTEPVASPPVMDQPCDESVCAPFIMPQPRSCSHVIGSGYTLEGLTELIFKKTENAAAGEYSVFKAETMMFSVRSRDTTLHSRLKLLDGDGKQIAMLWKKNTTAHARWVVSRIIRENELNLQKVFSVCKNSMFQRFTELNVIMGKKNSDADFKVTGSWTDKRCIIETGDPSQTKIAQMHPLSETDDTFKVEVDPNVDCAFVVSLVAILDAMKGSGKLKCVAGGAADIAGKFACGVGFAAAGNYMTGLF